MRKLSTLLSIPGQYSEGEKMWERRTSLVRILPARATRSQHHEQFDGHNQNSYRFIAMIRFPSLDRQTGNLDWGVSCQACRFSPDTRRGYRDWNIFYSASGYMEHFQTCETSQGVKAMAPLYVDPDCGDQDVSKARFLEYLKNLKFWDHFHNHVTARFQVKMQTEGTWFPKSVSFFSIASLLSLTYLFVLLSSLSESDTCLKNNSVSSIVLHKSILSPPREFEKFF